MINIKAIYKKIIYKLKCKSYQEKFIKLKILKVEDNKIQFIIDIQTHIGFNFGIRKGKKYSNIFESTNGITLNSTSHHPQFISNTLYIRGVDRTEDKRVIEIIGTGRLQEINKAINEYNSYFDIRNKK